MLQPISYRDNDGFVVVKGNAVYRYVKHSYADEYDHLIRSGLYHRLTGEGLLVTHQEINVSKEESRDFYKILIPELIDPMIFPFEWSVSQWKEAILNFLKINCICLEHGMILKDASPFNFAFHNGTCVFFDTLSFTFYKDGDAWTAYRQFCENMLGPFSLMSYNSSSWARMLQSYINGWSLSFVSANLPLRSWFNSAVLLHIHWHAKYGNKKGKAVRPGGFTKEKLLVLLNMLQRSVKKWKSVPDTSHWTAYYETGIVSPDYLESKVAIVERWMDDIRPAKVIDLGANNGRFSLLASLYAAKVISLEADHNCVEQFREQIKKEGITHIETVIADITQPTPGVGWRNQEKKSLEQRLHGDMVFGLALIHHLCIAANIPVPFVAGMFADITDRYALVEFVPRSDPKVVEMLLNREDIFTDYTEEQFIYCFEKYFNKVRVATCASSDRKLYLWERK